MKSSTNNLVGHNVNGNRWNKNPRFISIDVKLFKPRIFFSFRWKLVQLKFVRARSKSDDEKYFNSFDSFQHIHFDLFSERRDDSNRKQRISPEQFRIFAFGESLSHWKLSSVVRTSTTTFYLVEINGISQFARRSKRFGQKRTGSLSSSNSMSKTCWTVARLNRSWLTGKFQLKQTEEKHLFHDRRPFFSNKIHRFEKKKSFFIELSFK